MALAITWQEIGAYQRESLAELSAWDKKLIRRLDDAVLPLLNPAPSVPGSVPASHGKGVAALLKGVANRKKSTT